MILYSVGINKNNQIGKKHGDKNLFNTELHKKNL